MTRLAGFPIASLLALGCLCLSGSAHADLYKCVQNGKVEFRDSPCSGVKQVVIDDSQARTKARASERPAVCKKGDDECCFNTGSAMAKVYLSNLSTMAQNGLMASDLMREGCSKEISESCRSKCETGFKVEARGALK